MTPAPGSLHHVELQVRDLDAALASWGWLLGELGYVEEARWSAGATLRLGDAYLVIARAPRDVAHDRRGVGLSHLAFHAGSAAEVDRLWAAAPEHGWAHLYADRHPFAGGAGPPRRVPRGRGAHEGRARGRRLTADPAHPLTPPTRSPRPPAAAPPAT